MSLSARKRKKTDWKTFELEIAEILDGRIVKVYRSGKYADIRTPRLLVEAKWSDRRLRISAPVVLKLRELAFRHGLYPVLVAGTGRTRVVALVGDTLDDGIDSEVRRLLDYWYGMGYDVWVVPFTGEYSGTPGIVPTTSLRGFRYTQEGAKCHS